MQYIKSQRTSHLRKNTVHQITGKYTVHQIANKGLLHWWCQTPHYAGEVFGIKWSRMNRDGRKRKCRIPSCRWSEHEKLSSPPLTYSRLDRDFAELCVHSTPPLNQMKSKEPRRRKEKMQNSELSVKWAWKAIFSTTDLLQAWQIRCFPIGVNAQEDSSPRSSFFKRLIHGAWPKRFFPPPPPPPTTHTRMRARAHTHTHTHSHIHTHTHT